MTGSTGSTVTLKKKAWIVIGNVACMEKDRRKAMFDSAGMVVLLQAGLEIKDGDIAQIATITAADLCHSAEVASVLLDSHPDLVKALVRTFCTSGVCKKFKCEL